MIIELTEKNGKSIFINKNKIVKFYIIESNIIESNISYDKVQHTEIQLESCFLNVKETPQDIVAIINKYILEL